MEEIRHEIVKKLDLYNSKLTCSLTRRGLCGNININTVFENLKTDFTLEKIDKPRDTNIIDIYKLPGKNIYFKRLCICDEPCGISKCSTLKTKGSCDGHHAIIVSINDSIDIDSENDYVIDFTYKQMIFGSEHNPSLKEEEKENYPSNIKLLEQMPGYLFIKYNDYLKYNSNRIWNNNITKPCKNIVNTKTKYLKYQEKYLKYKYKYLLLKNKL